MLIFVLSYNNQQLLCFGLSLCERFVGVGKNHNHYPECQLTLALTCLLVLCIKNCKWYFQILIDLVQSRILMHFIFVCGMLGEVRGISELLCFVMLPFGLLPWVNGIYVWSNWNWWFDIMYSLHFSAFLHHWLVSFAVQGINAIILLKMEQLSGTIKEQ